MQKSIHPQYHTNLQVTCSCGAQFTVSSTDENLSTEVCSQCHPFFTGKQRLLDTSRRVEKFEEKLQKQAQNTTKRLSKKEKNALRAAKKAEKAAQIDETK